MGDPPLTFDPRLARRRARRRQIRRRRLTALAVLATAFGGIVVALGSRGGERAGATAPDPLGSGRPVTLAFGGDMHFEPPIRQRLASDPASILAGVAPVLRRADIAMVNVETAVTEGGTPAPKAFVFRAPPRAFDAVLAGGVDVVTMANNHGMDYGETGLRDSLQAAAAAGVPVVGIGVDDTAAYAPKRFTVNGQRIAIIAATQVIDDDLVTAWTAGPGKPGLASAKDILRLERAVREARESNDTVVVYMHWGTELERCPTPEQTGLARRLADAGADVIVGSHAHVLLGGGRLDGALVHYGLGNLAFYATREAAKGSGVLEVTVTGRRVDSYRWVPARISGGVPVALTGAAATAASRAWDELRTCTDLTR